MDTIINELDKAMAETVALLNKMDVKSINEAPAEGRWSAAQVGRHLYKAGNGMDGLLYAPAPKAGRQPDERAGEYKKILLDFNIRMDSPDYIIPEDKQYDKDELVQSLQQVRKAMVTAAQASDLETVPELPEENPLQGSTKLELIHFITYHTQRHNRQIKNIIEAAN